MDNFTENEQKAEDKAAMRKLLEVARPVPDEKGMKETKRRAHTVTKTVANRFIYTSVT